NQKDLVLELHRANGESLLNNMMAFEIDIGYFYLSGICYQMENSVVRFIIFARRLACPHKGYHSLS
ncbi:hypothetical protein ACFLWG_04555, partial [Chloroflexota bacterium]